MSFSDDFNRSNQTLETSANWTRVGGTAGALEIVSNRVRCTTSGADTAYQAPNQGTADHYVQTKLLDVGSYGGGASFLACRLADDNNFIGVRWTGSSWSVFRRVSGGFSSVGSFASPAPSVGDVIKLQCEGTNYALFRNGVSVGTGAIGAPTLTSTRTGLIARSAVQDPWLDDFETGSISAPAHKSGTGTINTSAAVSSAGRKRSRGSSAIAAASVLTGTGHKRAHGSASLSVAAAITGLGRKRAFGRAVMAHVITMTGGAAVEVHPDIQFDGAQPGEIALSGVMPGEIILTGRA